MSGRNGHRVSFLGRVGMVELLERETALLALAGVVDTARRGRGAVAVVTGEHGIGKTSLVGHFAREITPDVRVLWGSCDDLSTPRPLGPFRDIAAALSVDQDGELLASEPPHRFHSVLLRELEAAERPTLLVVEDVHWADEATLDAVTLLGRRIADVAAVLVLTFRSGDVAPTHPLHAALGAIQRNTTLHLTLAPLSYAAVTRLAGDRDADRIYGATRGNPFFVTEMVAAPPDELLLSVANAVLGRCARLGPESSDLVELVSMVPSRITTEVLDVVRPDWARAAEEPERHQLLTVNPPYVHFRHELARVAIRSNLPTTRQRRLHAQIVDGLLATQADPAEIVHHAEVAGRTDTVATYALTAAHQAATLESYREAWKHFRRASEFADRFDTATQAALFEQYAQTAYQVGHMGEAFSAAERAIAAYRQQGDESAVGRLLGTRSHFFWVVGDGNAAWQQVRSSIQLLEPAGPTAALAGAYNQLADLATLSGRAEEALLCGDRALRLAEQLGSDYAKWRALVAMGVAHMQCDPDDDHVLHAAVDGARVAGAHDAVVTGLIGLVFLNFFWVRPDRALEYAREGLEYAETHQRDALQDYLQANRAWLWLRSGWWPEAEASARMVLDRQSSRGMVSELQAKVALTELAVRRGDPDAGDRLAALAEEAYRTRELKRLGPVLELQIEWALTRDEPLPVASFEQVLATVGDEPARSGYGGARLAAWGTVLGLPTVFRGKAPFPHAAMMRQNWAEAAAGFGAVGWRYDRALMLSCCDDEPALAEAMEIARAFGATPLLDRVSRKLRATGRMIPRGPAASTRSNPAGLTDRQLEILGLIADGLTNAEIAKRLTISPRTIEHHVSSVLAKLDVTTRRDAARQAVELGVLRS